MQGSFNVYSTKIRRYCSLNFNFFWSPFDPKEGNKYRKLQSKKNGEKVSLCWATGRLYRWGVGCFTSDILDLCRAFFLKGKIGPRGHGPTFSSSEREKREKKKYYSIILGEVVIKTKTKTQSPSLIANKKDRIWVEGAVLACWIIHHLFLSFS